MKTYPRPKGYSTIRLTSEKIVLHVITKKTLAGHDLLIVKLMFTNLLFHILGFFFVFYETTAGNQINECINHFDMRKAGRALNHLYH